MQVELARIATADVPAAIALVTEVLAEFGLEFGKGAATDGELAELPEAYDSRGGAFWVAKTAGAIVGTCGVFPVAPDTFELRKMYLAPRARGHGVGKQLLATAIEWVRACGGRRVVLDTVDEMKAAIAFYEAHGFVRDDGEIRGSRCTRGYVLEL